MAERPRDEPEVLSVSRLLERVQDVLDLDLGTVWVEGEVFEFGGAHRSGHTYFKLRDARSVVSAIVWRSAAGRAFQVPMEEGRRVRARGRLDLYPPQGRLSIVLDRIEDVGAGDLARRFEDLKRKLRDEGLFDPEHKRPLPVRPRRVALVTAHPSAAAADVLRTLEERGAPLTVGLRPSLVQGPGAVDDLLAALAEAQQADVDLVLLSRGGGSLEDLWSFNEERLVRAVAASRVPVLVAVGHETDTTLADFAADASAKTPTAAAVALTEGWESARRAVGDLAGSLVEAGGVALGAWEHRLDELGRELRHHRPDWRLERLGSSMRAAEQRLVGALGTRLRKERERLTGTGRDLAEVAGPWRPARRRLDRSASGLLAGSPGPALARLAGRLEAAAGRLEASSPEAPLRRGYALVERAGGGGFLRSADQVEVGEALRIRLAEGALRARVEDHEPPSR